MTNQLQVVAAPSPLPDLRGATNRLSIPKIGREIIARTGTRRDAGKLVIHRTVWEFENGEIDAELSELVGDEWTVQLDRQVRAWLLKFADKLGPSATNLLAFQNGVTLNVDTGDVHPCRAEDNLRRMLRCDWNIAADRNAAWAFLRDAVPPEWVERLVETCALAIFPMPELQRLLWWWGPPGVGKGVQGRIVVQMIGLELVAATQPHQLERDHHASANLVGKVLNFTGDASTADLSQPREILKITGNDPVTINPKHGTPFDVVLPITMLFVSNILPSIADQADALGRRIAPVKFERQSDGPPDPTLTARLTTPDNLSAFAFIFMQALWNIRRRGGLAENETTLSAVDEFRRLTNTTAGFLEDRCEFGAELREHRPTLWRAFKAWTEEARAGQRLKQETFTTAIEADPRLTVVKVRGEFYVKGLALRSNRDKP